MCVSTVKSILSTAQQLLTGENEMGTKNIPTQNETTIIELNTQDGQILASSLEVAKKFGKEHKNILASVRSLINSKKFTELTFVLSEYKDASGKRNPMYWINRHGFSILVMGFNGDRALDWKIKYDLEFERMVKELNKPEPSSIEGQLLSTAKVLIEHRKEIDQIKETSNNLQNQINDINRDAHTATIAGWGITNSETIPRYMHQQLGNMCSRECRGLSISVKRASDAHWTEVNSYPISIIEKMFEKLNKGIK